MNQLARFEANYTDVLVQYAMILLSYQGNGPIGQGKCNQTSMCLVAHINTEDH